MRKNRKITNYLDEVNKLELPIFPLSAPYLPHVNALNMGYGRGIRLNALEAFYRAPMNSRQANYRFEAVKGVFDAFVWWFAPYHE